MSATRSTNAWDAALGSNPCVDSGAPRAPGPASTTSRRRWSAALRRWRTRRFRPRLLALFRRAACAHAPAAPRLVGIRSGLGLEPGEEESSARQQLLALSRRAACSHASAAPRRGQAPASQEPLNPAQGGRWGNAIVRKPRPVTVSASARAGQMRSHSAMPATAWCRCRHLPTFGPLAAALARAASLGRAGPPGAPWGRRCLTPAARAPQLLARVVAARLRGEWQAGRPLLGRAARGLRRCAALAVPARAGAAAWRQGDRLVLAEAGSFYFVQEQFDDNLDAPCAPQTSAVPGITDAAQHGMAAAAACMAAVHMDRMMPACLPEFRDCPWPHKSAPPTTAKTFRLSALPSVCTLARDQHVKGVARSHLNCRAVSCVPCLARSGIMPFLG